MGLLIFLFGFFSAFAFAGEACFTLAQSDRVSERQIEECARLEAAGAAFFSKSVTFDGLGYNQSLEFCRRATRLAHNHALTACRASAYASGREHTPCVLLGEFAKTSDRADRNGKYACAGISIYALGTGPAD